ncbi:MAG: hypothetical protein MJ025_01590 [Victivallaceae bacterium]|nr:hypothetical protein [Victivallaceae bacterium]
MTEKEKRFYRWSLWGLVEQGCHVQTMIMSNMSLSLRIVLEDGAVADIDRHRYLERLESAWKLVQLTHEDAVAAADELGHAEMIPELPEIDVDMSMWDDGIDGEQKVTNAVADTAIRINEALFKLMDVLDPVEKESESEEDKEPVAGEETAAETETDK